MIEFSDFNERPVDVRFKNVRSQVRPAEVLAYIYLQKKSHEITVLVLGCTFSAPPFLLRAEEATVAQPPGARNENRRELLGDPGLSA